MKARLLFKAASNKRLERTRHNGSSICSSLGEPLKRNVMSLSPIMQQPRVTVQMTFLSPAEGGRQSLPTELSGGHYRPHVVVGDPTQRKAQLVNNVAREKYLGVAFVEGPAGVVADEPFIAQLALMYWPNVSYDSLVPGATFTLREGPDIIGFGTVQTAPTNGAT